jgi:hypothetical protein
MARAETRAESAESREGMSASGWVLAGFGVIGLIGIFFLIKRRRGHESISILDRDAMTSHRSTLAHRL